MIMNVMTWNTALYMFGNKKPIGDEANKTFDEIFEIIKKYFLENENAIVILQEIPNCWYPDRLKTTHPFFEKYMEICSKEKWYSIYNKTKKDTAIKMTVVLANKENLIQKVKLNNDDDSNNIYVSFQIAPDTIDPLTVLAVHSHDAKECQEFLKRNKNISYSLILGDFNSGYYDKQRESNEFKENRKKYCELIEAYGYEDKCLGQNTTTWNTPIDHVLMKRQCNYEVKNLKIDYEIKFSDHYPITFKLVRKNLL